MFVDCQKTLEELSEAGISGSEIINISSINQANGSDKNSKTNMGEDRVIDGK